MTQYWTLVRREFLDHKGGMLWVPAVVAVLIALAAILGAAPVLTGHVSASHVHFGPSSITIDSDGFKKTITEDGETAELTKRFPKTDADIEHAAEAIGAFSVTSAAPLVVIALAIVPFILLGSLYDERQDRSILFWKSLPVSDTVTILSKLVTATVGTVAISLAIGLILQLILLIIGSAIAVKLNIPHMAALWNPVTLAFAWFDLVLGALIYMLWALPLYGWFLLVSAWAPRSPILIAFVGPAAAALLEQILLKTHFIGDQFGGRIMGAAMVHSLDAFGDKGSISLQLHSGGRTVMQSLEQWALHLLSSLANLELWIGVAVAVALLYTTIEVRRRKAL